MNVIPKSNAQTIEILSSVENAVSRHPIFGDDVYIQDQLATSFGRRLKIVAKILPSAERLQKALDLADPVSRRRLVGDTALRCGIKCAHAHVVTGEEQGLPLGICDALFSLAEAHAQDKTADYLSDRGRPPMARIGADACHAAIWNDGDWDSWLWSGNQNADLYSRTFRYIVNEHALGPLATVDDDDIRRIRLGQQLLEAIVPSLAASVSMHTHLVGIFDPIGRKQSTASSSQYRVSGTIFINRNMLLSPWDAAEHLLHESLHQKLYDIRAGHTLFSDDFNEENERRVTSLWNSPGLDQANRWNTHRAMAAFHVYVHLALMARMVECRIDELEQAFGPRAGMISSGVALDRARYLSKEIRDKCGSELGHAGKRMHQWMTDALDVIDDCAYRKNFYSHLFLKRFTTEGRRVSSLLRRSEMIRDDFGVLVENLASEELNQAREIIFTLQGETAVQRFNLRTSRLDMGHPDAELAESREVIATFLLEPTSAEYVETLAKLDRDGRTQKMVESGSERLLPVLLGLPLEVICAKRRAIKFQFGKSCADEVGRLLAAVAAGTPRNGRIMEIGTGAGVGLSWIISGLQGRDDVQVLSIEVDDFLASDLRASEWPSYVDIMEGDASSLITQLGTFDVIFVDASPFKFEKVELAIRALRPGGKLILDDLIFKEGLSSTSNCKFKDKIKYLRHALSSNAELSLYVFDSSTGVVLASRR